jgi:ketosteroid isomerase-like protein
LTIASSQAIGDKAAHNGNDEQEVRTLMPEWDEAYMRRDTDALDRILADDFIFTDAVGAVSNKACYVMAVIKSPDMTLIEPLGSDDVIVLVYGDDAAVVTGRSPIKGRPRRTATNDLYRFTDRWVRRQGHWQVVASQVTRVAAQ